MHVQLEVLLPVCLACASAVYFVATTSFRVGDIWRSHKTDRERLNRLAKGHRKLRGRVDVVEDEVKTLKGATA